MSSSGGGNTKISTIFWNVGFELEISTNLGLELEHTTNWTNVTVAVELAEVCALN